MSSRTMGKTAARERAAAHRAAQARAARRRRVLLASGAIGVVMVLVVALVVAKAAGVGSGDDATTTARPAGPRVVAPGVQRAVTSVPAATLDEVGAGSVQAVPSSIEAPELTDGGKPKVLYVGAEYCPFCAAQRWPVVVALSRFGTWSHLTATSSATNDVHPDTQTVSFHGATYTSDYLTFTGVETSTNEIVDGRYVPLDELSAADQKTFDTYDRPPYVQGSAGGIPFLDVAGRYVSSGASFDPQLLAGKSRAEIAAALGDPGDPLAQAVDGSANVLTAALCQVTGQQPAQVCSSAGVASGADALANGRS
jgi:hypothetical protein